MTTDITIDKDNKIIHRTETGEMVTERSLTWVRELALTIKLHEGYNILMDLRETETQPEMLDLMAIASECARLKSDFNSKIAFLIPNTEARVKFANLFKACMEAQGFQFKQFFDHAAAMAWLTEKP
jgi:hypothetical protein